MERFLTYVRPPAVALAADCEIVCDAYPSYTLKDLEKFVAEGKGNPAMVLEIENRKAGTSKPKVTPQIMGGKVQTKLGRM